MNAKPGRNDPCPCGSGRKYKACCLHAAAAAGAAAGARRHYADGTSLLGRGRMEEAVTSFRRALSLQPDFFEALVDLGNALNQLRRPQEALGCFRRALALRPGIVPLRMNIGACLDELGQRDEAIACYREAIELDPAHPQLRHNLGTALRRAGRTEEAAQAFRASLACGQTDSWTFLSLCGTLLEAARYTEALETMDRAIALRPSEADFHDCRGSVLLTIGRVREAIESFERVAAVAPGGTPAASLLLARLYPDDVPEAAVAADAADFSRRFEVPLQSQRRPLANSRDAQRKLRIGYVSADFRAHSVAYFFEPVLEHHDRERFCVHCYHATSTNDEVTARLRARADAWVDCATWSDEALARRIQDDAIDILVDLSGHTSGSRLLAFARRPAPVQLSWIGYPSATGSQAIQAMISDPIASPRGSGIEQGIARLPRVFSCYRPHAQAPQPERKRDAPSDAVWFGSFNNAAKISDTAVRLWARILNARPDARLALKDKSFSEEACRAWMRRRFADHGIDAGRIELWARTRGEPEHLALYSRIDVALDTFPYGGVTTTCEALWMGVPVVSLAGPAFRSRMGATLLAAAGHPQWVAEDEDGYVRRALQLAGDAPLRERLRAGLREQLRASPLLDEPGVARELELLYRESWTRWCAVPA